MIVHREVFSTSDDRIFESRQDAIFWQAKIDLKKKYEENRLLGNVEGSYVKFEDLIGWLEDNETLVLNFYLKCREV